jgi:hypothetical protein
MTVSDDTATKLGRLVGLSISAFLITCLRAWMLSLCAAILFPTFVLGFWQWWLLAFTFRLMTGTDRTSND